LGEKDLHRVVIRLPIIQVAINSAQLAIITNVMQVSTRTRAALPFPFVDVGIARARA